MYVWKVSKKGAFWDFGREEGSCLWNDGVSRSIGRIYQVLGDGGLGRDFGGCLMSCFYMAR